jgi:CHAD domain-containing protein
MVSLREFPEASPAGPCAAGARRTGPKRGQSPVDGPSLQGGFFAACRPLAGELAGRRSLFLADPDALNVHALRGAARRLRAAIWLFEAALPPVDATWIRRELKWLTRRLGAVRDLDVLLGRIADPQSHDNVAGIRPEDRLSSLATRARQERVEAAVAALRSARATVLVEGFEAWLLEAAAGLDANARASVAVQPALAGLDARIHAAGRHIAGLTTRRRHALRGEIKTLRYATETFDQFAGAGVTSPRLPALLELSHVLGDLNDDSVCAELAERLAPGSAAPSEDRKARLRTAWAAFEASGPRRSSTV